MSNGVTSWSYSAADAHGTCPFKFANERGLGGFPKNKGPQGPAMARGDKIHKAGEAWLKGEANPFPVEFIRFKGQMEELKAQPRENLVIEEQWGFTKQWKQAGWFGPTTWFRNKLDAAVAYEDDSADVVDYKTGKIYDKNAEQRELNALAFFQRFPHIEHVTSRMWYLDDKGPKPERLEDFDRAQVPEMLKKWEKKIEPMFTDTVFAPRPNEFCFNCHLSKSKGGPCRFG